MTTIRHLVRFIAPILYAAGFVPVMVGVIVVLSLVENRMGFDNFTTFRYNGDVAVVASILVIGGLVFGLLGEIFVWLERLRTPTVRAHLRHCAALYVFMGTLGVWLVANYENLAAHGVSLGYGLAVVGLFTAGYAVFIDALLLLRQIRRSGFVESGDPA